MALSVTDNFTTQEALEYAQLCELARANWKWDQQQQRWILDKPQKEYLDLWNALQDKYNVYYFRDETETTGYSGTVFQCISDGRKILVNRGSDGPNDASADLSISIGSVPAEQFRSMVELISYLNLQNFDIIGERSGVRSCISSYSVISTLHGSPSPHRIPGRSVPRHLPWQCKG